MRTSFRLAAALLVVAPAALAFDYLPIDESVLRHYAAVSIPPQPGFSTYFSGTVAINQTDAHVLHYVGGADDGLKQFWSKDEHGNVLFHGFEAGNISIVWSPAFVMLVPPFTIGRQWLSRSTEPTRGTQVVLYFEVLAVESVRIEGTDYESVTIGIEESTTSIAQEHGLSMFGHRIAASSNVAGRRATNEVTWGDEGGILQWKAPDRTDVLVAFGSTAVETRTWSAIRGLYR